MRLCPSISALCKDTFSLMSPQFSSFSVFEVFQFSGLTESLAYYEAVILL